MSQINSTVTGDDWIQVDAGDFYDVKINGQTIRICGEARLNLRTEWAWFADRDRFMDLKEIPVHGAKNPHSLEHGIKDR